jgi:serine/threonine protein kinase
MSTPDPRAAHDDLAGRTTVPPPQGPDVNAAAAARLAEGPTIQLVPASLLPPEAGAALPTHRIGSYTVRRLIGTGGMGAVYEAEQDNPKRIVALKVLRSGIASASAQRRFEYESQLLARLRHPGIA